MIRLPALITLSLATLMLGSLMLSSSAAQAARVRILATIDDDRARTGPIEARADEQVTLYAAVQVGRRWYTDAPRPRLRGKVRPLADLKATAITWSQIEPRPHHVETPPPNLGNPAYSNSVLFGPKHGKWLGYDTLEYVSHPAQAQPSAPGVLPIPQIKPTHPKLRSHGGLGTMRYAVRVELPDGEVVTSPGLEAQSRGGIERSVFRLSVRSGDDLLGWLTSYYNVPNVFGSAGKGRKHQTDLHQGADCADVIVGAARKAGSKMPYVSVAGLRPWTRPLTKRLYLDAEGLKALTEEGPGEAVVLEHGADVKRGDLMLIKYARHDWTGRRWDHIAVVGADRGEPGVFDPEDPVWHMGYLYGLIEEPARKQGLMVVQFVRLKKR